MHGDIVKYQHREADNRARRFKSTFVEADPVSKNYFTSRHGETSPGTPESSVSWLADGMLGTQGLQSMRMAIRRRPEQVISARLCQPDVNLSSHPLHHVEQGWPTSSHARATRTRLRVARVYTHIPTHNICRFKNSR
jgi:hypothetical protein